jgi:hypothetical protein
MQTVSIDAWDFGEYGFCDEQDIGFTGNHRDKQQINYKKEGGFLSRFHLQRRIYLLLFLSKPVGTHSLPQPRLFTNSLTCLVFFF